MKRTTFLKGIGLGILSMSFKVKSVEKVVKKHEDFSYLQLNNLIEEMPDDHPGYIFEDCRIHQKGTMPSKVFIRDAIFKRCAFDTPSSSPDDSWKVLKIETKNCEFRDCYLELLRGTELRWYGWETTELINTTIYQSLKY